MTDITTDFVGSENATTRLSRLQLIYDYYYGSGAFVAANNLGGVRSGINALVASDISNGEAFGSWLTKANYANDPDNLRTELDTLTTTKTAALWDFATSANIFQDSGFTVPGVAANPIGGLEARAIGGLSNGRLTSLTTQRPTWQTNYADFDGTTDELATTTSGLLPIFQNAAQIVLAASFRLDALAANATILSFSEGVTSTAIRGELLVTTTGAVQVNVRRTDGGSSAFDISDAGLIVTNTIYSVVATVDFATGGANAIRAYINNASDILGGTLSGSGNTSNTASLNIKMGVGLGGGARMDGRVYRAYAGAFMPTTAERALINGVLRGGL